MEETFIKISFEKFLYFLEEFIWTFEITLQRYEKIIIAPSLKLTNLQYNNSSSSVLGISLIYNFSFFFFFLPLSLFLTPNFIVRFNSKLFEISDTASEIFQQLKIIQVRKSKADIIRGGGKNESREWIGWSRGDVHSQNPFATISSFYLFNCEHPNKISNCLAQRSRVSSRI